MVSQVGSYCGDYLFTEMCIAAGQTKIRGYVPMDNATYNHIFLEEKDALTTVGFPFVKFQNWMTSKKAVGDLFETAILCMWTQDQPKGIVSLVAYAWELWEKYHEPEKFPTKLAKLKAFKPEAELVASESVPAEAGGPSASSSSWLDAGAAALTTTASKAAPYANAPPIEVVPLPGAGNRQPCKPWFPSWLDVAQQADATIQLTGFDETVQATMATTALYTCTTKRHRVVAFGGTASHVGPQEHPEPQVIAQGKGFELLLKGSAKSGNKLSRDELLAAAQANAPIIATGYQWTKSALRKVEKYRRAVADNDLPKVGFTSGGTLNMYAAVPATDLAENYTTGFPDAEREPRPPKVIYTGDYNWDNIGSSFDEDDASVCGMDKLSSAGGEAPSDADQAASLNVKAEEHDAQVDSDEDNWGAWVAPRGTLQALALQHAGEAMKQSKLDEMD